MSKSYQIGGSRPRYKTLRESLVNTLAASVRRFRSRWSPAPSSSETIWALKNLTFDVEHGEVLGIIGRNGAGKSTLLKVLSRITPPTSGHADVRGRVGSLLEVGTGFHPELTGRENIYLNGAILGMRKVEIQRKFDEIVEFSEVAKFLDTPVKHYSSGMYMRLAFSVAAHLDPEILVVDEVLAVGDASFQAKCLNKMQDVSKGGRTVLFVSHNMGAIRRLCPRSLLLDGGEIVTSGPTDEVIGTYLSRRLMDQPEYVQPHNPEKPINLRRCALKNTTGELANEFRYDEDILIDIEYEVNRAIADCSVWVGIRTLEESLAFGTADTDCAPQLLQRRECGKYQTIVRLPRQWLNFGKYYVVVGIVRSGAVTFDRTEAFGFSVLDIGTPEPGRPGLLQPFLDWTTTRAEHVSSGS